MKNIKKYLMLLLIPVAVMSMWGNQAEALPSCGHCSKCYYMLSNGEWSSYWTPQPYGNSGISCYCFICVGEI